MVQRNSNVYDEDLILQASVTKTASFNGTGVAIKLQKNQVAKAVIDVSAIDTDDADEAYVAALEVSDDDTTYLQVGRSELSVDDTPTIGRYEIPVLGSGVEKVIASATHARLRVELSGTTPSITYSGFLTKV